MRNVFNLNSREISLTSDNDSQNDENCRFAAKSLPYIYRVAHLSETIRVFLKYRSFKLLIFSVKNKIHSFFNQSASGEEMLFRSKIKGIERNRLIFLSIKRQVMASE